MIAETARSVPGKSLQPITSDNSPLAAVPPPAPGGALARPFGSERAAPRHGAPSFAEEP